MFLRDSDDPLYCCFEEGIYCAVIWKRRFFVSLFGKYALCFFGNCDPLVCCLVEVIPCSVEVITCSVEVITCSVEVITCYKEMLFCSIRGGSML